MSFGSQVSQPANNPVVRWGFVGTGQIATTMAGIIRTAPSAQPAAVSSRNLKAAKAFASLHGINRAFGAWAELIVSDDVDAVYVATPTSVREEICIAAANCGKHVLGEKPFASLASLQRITKACKDNGVVFMDATHFVHHPRTRAIQASLPEMVGRPASVNSAFRFNLPDRNNIRYDPQLEPRGAIGDVAWYNMRATIEYLSPDVQLRSVNAYLRRDSVTGAVIGGSGILVFDDASTSAWNCAFDSGATIVDLRIWGPSGTIDVPQFLGNNEDGSASYTCRRGDPEPGGFLHTVIVDSALSSPALMFEDFSKLVHDRSLREPSINASERTQNLLDAVWNDAIRNEKAC